MAETARVGAEDPVEEVYSESVPLSGSVGEADKGTGQKEQEDARSQGRDEDEGETASDNDEEGGDDDGDDEGTVWVTDHSGYQYQDHTADIQFYSWAPDLKEAFELQAVAMFGYMTDLRTVEIDESGSRTLEASAHDMQSLLFAFLDEWLFLFSTEFFVAKEVKILEFDRENWRIRSQGRGERFSLAKHPQGTEIKAITYSNMQIREDPVDGATVYCIVDI